jgi:outer membrane receptor protein involved in Fe transport
VPQRAIDSGLIGRYGSLDPSSGGKTQRFSLSADWSRRGANSRTQANAWLLDYQLDLYSNFTYALNDAVNGDQFKQADRRRAGGFAGSHTVYERWGGFEVDNTIGVDSRIDRIRPVGLYTTSARTVLATTREDRVDQRSIALYAQNQTRWLDKFRTVAGLRADFYRFAVDSNISANSGLANDQMLSPKLSAIFGPWGVSATEFYLNYGQGFHSNDARGATLSVDPSTGAAAGKVTPLVKTRGYEVGVRSEPLPGWLTSVSLWALNIDSELLFVGDAGVTEPSRASRRYGVEWNNLYTVNSRLAFDADIALSHARFRGDDPANSATGNYIPGSVATTANLGVTVDHLGPWFGAFRIRHFGPRPLIEDNSQRSAATTLANLRWGYRFDRRTTLALDVFNLFDRKVSDIDYWYASQLRGEAAPVSDIHTHPAEPRVLRLTLSHRF